MNSNDNNSNDSNSNSTDKHTIGGIEWRGHCHTEYDPSEFVEAYNTAESEETRAAVRGAFSRLDGGRFEDMIDAAHNVMAHSDTKRQQAFADDHPELLRWVGAWGLIQDLNTFAGHSGMVRKRPGSSAADAMDECGSPYTPSDPREGGVR